MSVVIGVTGPIGAGKSFATDILKRQGAKVLDADKMAHHCFRKGTEPYRLIVDRFGDEVVDKKGEIDRKKLGGIVFNDEKQLQQLNRIVHPPLLDALRRVIEEFRRNRPNGVVVIDAALLFAWNFQKHCDWVLWIDASTRKRKERMVSSGRLTGEQFEKRDRLQRSMFEDVAMTKKIVRITNEESPEILQQKIKRFLKDVKENENQK